MADMLQKYLSAIITDFCTYFDNPIENISYETGSLPEIKLQRSSEVVNGFRNLVAVVCHGNNVGTPEYYALQDQWIEYAFTKGLSLQNSSNTPHILKEMDEHISDKAFFLGNKQSPVDVLLYFLVYDAMVNFTPQEKENYMNVSRWFNYMQQDGNLRKWRSLIGFSRIRLYK